MMKKLGEVIAPPNSIRRLLFSLLRNALAQPRDFFRYVNPDSLRYFYHYLRATDPALVEGMVAEVLARDRVQADETGRMNHFILPAVRRGGRVVPPPSRAEPVEVIIPVFNAPELTQSCLESVLAHSEQCRLIVVDDASTDQRVATLLDSLRGVPERGVEVVVLRNEENLGFVRTVNRAWSHTRGHFAILNSDTEVPPGWLERLFAPILADPERVGSVTPFSNAAMACSFPEPNRDNPPFKGLSAMDLDSYFRGFGSEEPLEIFAGVGFCMAFNRVAVEHLGLFDEESFGRGYGEEVDWSLRAYDAGFRHVLAADLYVFHRHGGSFTAGERGRLLERNQGLIWQRHRGQMTRLRETAAADLPRGVRETVALAADAGSRGAERRVALIDMDIPGGATLYSANLAAHLCAAGLGVVHLLFNHRQGYLKLRVESSGVNSTYILPREAPADIAPLLQFLGCDAVIVNELVSWPEPLVTMARVAALGLPYVVLVHDYFFLCPGVFLIGHNGVHCGLPANVESCRSCLPEADNPLLREFYGHGLDDLSVWRDGCRQFLAGARNVICFSAASAEILQKAYSGLANVMVNEHTLLHPERFDWRERCYDGTGPLHVGVIGNLFAIKGERIVAELMASPRFARMPIKVTVFGSTPLYPAGHRSADGRLVFHGSYEQEELPKLLEGAGVHVVLVPSIWPETFSYTTSEALALGYPVICFDLGAQAERVAKNRCGIVVGEVSAAALLDALQRLVDDPPFVAEMSRNARNYLPPNADAHFGRIVSLVNGKTDGAPA